MPTVTLRVLFVFIVIEHRRRQVLHFNVTAHPTAEWTAQQIVETFPNRTTTDCYLIRDRDGVFGSAVRLKIRGLGIHEIVTAPQSPWQNAYAERLIGSIRRECLNHIIILNASHLRRTLTKYFGYYHECRPHLGSKSNVQLNARQKASVASLQFTTFIDESPLEIAMDSIFGERQLRTGAAYRGR